MCIVLCETKLLIVQLQTHFVLIVTGIALDDTFIITGAYFRRLRERKQSNSEAFSDEEIVAIIQQTMNEVGVSISMTTCTTLVCFLQGLTSSIPAVRWLCLYAATVLAVDFFYQCTVFISFLTLDERRVRANRRDLCLWIVVKDDEEKEEDDEIENATSEEYENEGDKRVEDNNKKEKSASPSKVKGQLDKNFMERFMIWYADKLTKPRVKLFVIVAFLAYFAGCTYSTTLLYQEFNIADYVPRDSMLTSFMVAFQQYTSIQRFIGVYFR
jgi:Niemann-Pick C1 protein